MLSDDGNAPQDEPAPKLRVKDFGGPETDDALAVEESQQIAQGVDLDQDAKKREHGRKQWIAWLITAMASLGIITGGVVLIAALLTWGVHVMAPLSWHWLDDAGMKKVETILFSGVLAVIVSDYAKKYF